MLRALRLLIAGFLLLVPVASPAAVELGIVGSETPPRLIDDIYLRNGVNFIAVKDIVEPLGLEGSWDTGKHLYRITGKGGTLLLSPASRYLRCGTKVVALKQKPRFIEGELRVPEEVVALHLPKLLGLTVLYRPAAAQPPSHDAESPPPDPPLPPPPPISGLRRIIIDPGHGGADPGGIAADGVKEKDLVLEIARRLERQFKRANEIPVVLTRDGDYAVPPKRRTPEVDGWPEENLLISLHLASWPQTGLGGGTIFTPNPTETEGTTPDIAADRLAELLAAAMTREGLTIRPPRRHPLYPFTATAIPTVVVEPGYLSNPDDLKLLRSEEGQERIARALYLGVRNYLKYLKETN